MARQSSIPGYLSHDSGQARVVLNGRTFYLGKHGSKASKQRYDALIAEWLASGRSQLYGTESHSEVLMQDLMLAYMSYCEQRYRKAPDSETEKNRLILRVVASLYCDLPANEFGPTQYKAVRERLLNDPTCQRADALQASKETKPLSRSYVNGQMKRVSRMFKWAAGEGILHADIYSTLRLIPSLQRGRTKARETEAVQPVDPADVESVIDQCTSVVASMIRIQLLTGCRPGEVCRLTPGMIDRSGPVWIASPKEHKTAHHGREKSIYIGPRGQEVIQPFLFRDAEKSLFSPAESESERRAGLSAKRTTPMGYGNRPGTNRKKSPKRSAGESYTTETYRRAIHYACDRAKVNRWSPNQLRHSTATDIRRQFGLDGAQVILGHAKADITQIYAEQDRMKAIEIALKVG